MVDFNKLRERRGTNFAALQAAVERTGQGGGYKKDPRIWTPTKKDNKSQNIIRFLPIPAVDMEAVEREEYAADMLTPMAMIMKHEFQGPRGWYMENSLQTFNETCPIREHDQPLWGALKKKDEKQPSTIAEKEVLKKRLPKTYRYVNILVIQDHNAPENNGKVFLYAMPVTVSKLIDSANAPEFDTTPSFDPYDPVTGANLNLNLTYVKKVISGKEVDVPDFKGCMWASPGPLAGGDEEEQEKIWRIEHSLLEFYNRKNFKTYEELKKKFCEKMGMDENYCPIAPGSTVGKSAEQFLANPAPTAPAPSTGSVAQSSSTTVTPTASTGPQNTAVATPAATNTPPEMQDDLAEFERMLAGG